MSLTDTEIDTIAARVTAAVVKALEGRSVPRQATPAAPGGYGGGGTVRFGRDKGKRLCDVSDLTWYRDTIAKGIDDPTRARYRDDGIAHLAEIDAAIRGEASAPATAGSDTDDGIPF